jgi:hypothetical protein
VSSLCSPDVAVNTTEPVPLISTPEASPNLTEPRNARVELGEELPSADHVMSGASVEAPSFDHVVAGVVAEESACFRLIKVEECRCGRCRWR